MGDTETVTLSQVFLGLNPYVLVEVVDDEEAEGGWSFRIQGSLPGDVTTGALLATVLVGLAQQGDESAVEVLRPEVWQPVSDESDPTRK
jgi:hypothetical protein